MIYILLAKCSPTSTQVSQERAGLIEGAKKINMKSEYTHTIATTDRTMAQGIAGDLAFILSHTPERNEFFVMVMTHDGPQGPFKLRAEDIIDPFKSN